MVNRRGIGWINAAISACFEMHRFIYRNLPLSFFTWDAQTDSGKSVVDVPTSAEQRGGEHDFDFEFGTWKTELTRLLHPLSLAGCGCLF